MSKAELQHLENSAMLMLEYLMPALLAGYALDDPSKAKWERNWKKLRDRHQALVQADKEAAE